MQKDGTDMGNPFVGASDRQLRKLYRSLLKKWEYYMVNSLAILATGLTDNLRLLSDEMERRKAIHENANALYDKVKGI